MSIAVFFSSLSIVSRICFDSLSHTLTDPDEAMMFFSDFVVKVIREDDVATFVLVNVDRGYIDLAWGDMFFMIEAGSLWPRSCDVEEDVLLVILLVIVNTRYFNRYYSRSEYWKEKEEKNLLPISGIDVIYLCDIWVLYGFIVVILLVNFLQIHVYN